MARCRDVNEKWLCKILEKVEKFCVRDFIFVALHKSKSDSSLCSE
jgi:hypothetical protein